MNINRIQTIQVVPLILSSAGRKEPRVDVGRGLSPEPSALVASSPSGLAHDTQASVVQSQGLLNRIDCLKDQLDKILVSFPPFFPAGSYQRVDLIKGIRGIQDEVEKSSVQSELTQGISSSKLTEHATDSDISAALDKLFNFGDELSKNLLATSESPQPGTLVNIKI